MKMVHRIHAAAAAAAACCEYQSAVAVAAAAAPSGCAAVAVHLKIPADAVAAAPLSPSVAAAQQVTPDDLGWPQIYCASWRPRVAGGVAACWN